MFMAKRKRLRRKKIGYWKIRKTLNPPWAVIARAEWKPLPKEAYNPRKVRKSPSRK